jgi:hypothetical protein
MELLLTLIIFAAFVYGIYKWAESKGRNAVIWAIAAALVSPLIVGIILLFVPKTLEKQAEEAKRLKELMNE